MRFVNKWSYDCANKLTIALNENHQKKSIYYYGFQIVFGGIVKLTLLVATSFLLGILVPTVLISLVFASLRVIAGGYHMDTSGKCIIMTLGMFLTAGLIAKYTYTYWSTMSLILLLAVTFILGLYILIRYAPKDTPNKPITDPKEIRKFKRLSIIHLFVWSILTAVLTAFHLNLYTITSCFAVLLELFCISPIGHKFFDIIKYRLNIKGLFTR